MARPQFILCIPLYFIFIYINSKDYKKYSEQTRMKLINDIYKTYDKYLSNKYKVNVNNNAVERVKKYFEWK